MRWKNRRHSSNVEDRRGQGVSKGAAIGGGSIIMALVAIFLFGQDPGQVIQGLLQPSGEQSADSYQPNPQEQQVYEFMEVVMADTEDTWGNVFQQAGYQYKEPKLVVYSGATQTACGTGQAASGPFYCPGDQKVYIDLSFLNELHNMGAQGDFAVAYVLAHEVGHHIQTITGTSDKVRQAQQRASKVQSNAIQVRMELQADCYAGIWAKHTQQRTQFLERGDLEEAMNAAAAVGDDQIMRKAGQTPRREAFTHGSSKERMEWFNRGLQSGDLNACDTGIN